MNTEDIVDIVENLVFWILVVYIAWNENATPQWVYIVLFALIVYFAVRTIFRKRGMDRMVWLYSLNMLVLVYLLYYFSRR